MFAQEYEYIQQAYKLFQKSPGPEEELYMILLTKEWFDFRKNFTFLLLFLVTVLTSGIHSSNDIHFFDSLFI